MMSDRKPKILDIEKLSVTFSANGTQGHSALNSVDLAISEGGTLGIVGESGSGKTVLALSILGLLPRNGRITSGSIRFDGSDLLTASGAELQAIRGKEIAMIFQDPQASLNPVYRVGTQMEWILKAHHDLVGSDAKSEVLQLFDAVHLHDPKRIFGSYPHELSGGMCQRVMIAMALACRPKLLIADEPTSSLDVTTQTEILELIREVRRQFSMSLLFISHDVGAVAELCDQVLVMLKGRVVESGSTSRIFQSPQAPYTQTLVASASRMGHHEPAQLDREGLALTKDNC